MAIELCSDNGISPRISFSHDFCISDIVPVEQQHSVRPGSIDFDFCTRKSFDQESSPADELFSDGKLLPTDQIKKPTKNHTITPSILDGDSSKIQKKVSNIDHEGEEKHSNNSKSFWRFKRSSSLNCVSGYGRSLCPLPLLSRSNSTGSTPNNVKRVPLSKDNSTSKQQKHAFMKSQSLSSSSSSSSSGTNYQKPPLKKNYGNGVRVNPVLNVPSGNLFGLGSIFFNGKDKNRKK